MGIKASDVVKVMQDWIGVDKKQIIDIYNSHKPLALGYTLKYTDAWCDGTVSAAFIKLGATDLIGGTECGVERHIALFKKKGIWVEDGTITPKMGDIICYNWDKATQPNDGFADHIGIVEKVTGNNITVIEGNFNEAVRRRTIPVGWGYIRGYAQPKYEAETSSSAAKPVSESKNSPGGNSGKTVSIDLTKPIVDVSEWQGQIDWEKAKPNIGGAIIRVAYGLKKDDNYVKRNLDECERLGIPFGVYLYSLAYSEAMAKAEAAKALELVKGRKLSLPIYIDIEENQYGYIAKTVAKAFCDAIKASGFKFGVYTFESYYRNFLSGLEIPSCSWWIARYGTNDGTKQANNKPKLAMDGWQYTSVGKIPGINSNVDMSEFYTNFSGKTATQSPEPAKTETKKTVDDTAKEVIDGKWGNGEERIKALTAAGWNANDVQKRVNEMLGASNTVTYEVKSGDTLSGIAAKYGVSYLKIAADNGIANPNKIYVGQKLTIKR